MADAKMFDWLDPNRMLTTAYCRYVLLKDKVRVPTANATAEIEVAFLNGLQERVTPGSTEEVFLSDVRSHVISYSEALLRRKVARDDALAQAYKMHDIALKQRRAGVNQRVAMAITKWVVGMTAIATVGVSLALTIRGVLPHGTEERTGILGPILGFASVPVLITYIVLILFGSINGQRIFNELDKSRNLARETYSRAKLHDFNTHWEHFKRAYESYTGKTFTESAWYRLTMTEDLEDDQQWSERARQHTTSDLGFAASLLKGKPKLHEGAEASNP